MQKSPVLGDPRQQKSYGREAHDHSFLVYAALPDCDWENVVYNLALSVKTLRCEITTKSKRWLQCSPAMAAGLTDHIGPSANC
jgi:hypothetical protein